MASTSLEEDETCRSGREREGKNGGTKENNKKRYDIK